MKCFLRIIIRFLASLNRGMLAGKMIGMFDYCRELICNNKKTFAGLVHQRMAIDNLIPAISDSINIKEGNVIESTSKVKVRIIYPRGCAWNHIHSLYMAFSKDDRFQTYVLVPDKLEYIRVLDRYDVRYVPYSNYSFKGDRPDILIATFYSSYDSEIIYDGCRKYIRKVFAQIPNVVMNEKTDEIHWKFISYAYNYLEPDYWIADPLVYNSLQKFIEHAKLVKMGSPQFDEIFEEVGKNHPWPESWKKLEGKKIFLWATDHGINESYPTNGFTIDLYLGQMLSYFNEHPERALIFRPHPEFVREMLRNGHFWSTDDIDKLKSYMQSTPNIVWDDTHDYTRAYDACDALIVDANCSITCSFLVTGKPVCRLLRDDIEEWLISPELKDSYYYAHGFKECVEYMDMICENQDPKAEIRNKSSQMAIMHFDGKNGERIKDFVESKFD